MSSHEVTQMLPIMVGLATTLALTGFTPHVMTVVKMRDDVTPEIKAGEEQRWDLWLRATANQHVARSSRLLGALESTLFFVGILTSQVAIIGGWLAFKLAAKWEAWNNVIAPNAVDVPFQDGLRNLWARHRWGAQLFRRFLIGTLYNLLCAGIGTAVTVLLRASP